MRQDVLDGSSRVRLPWRFDRAGRADLEPGPDGLRIVAGSELIASGRPADAEPVSRWLFTMQPLVYAAVVAAGHILWFSDFALAAVWVLIFLADWRVHAVRIEFEHSSAVHVQPRVWLPFSLRSRCRDLAKQISDDRIAHEATSD